MTADTIQEKAATPKQDEPNRLILDVASYIGLAFGLSWVLLIGAVKLGLSEEYLNIGVAGPALAGLLLSRHHDAQNVPSGIKKWFCFIFLLALCWIVLCLHYLWWASNAFSFHLKPYLLIPALPPAWIVSNAFASDCGVRAFAKRLVHRPRRWSAYALLFFPLLLGAPSLLAYWFGAKLMWPGLGGFGLASCANAFVFFLYNLLFVGFEEEPGWRGFLLDRLQSKFSPLAASLLVWLPWALWHAPLDYYRPVRFTLVQEVLLRVVFLVPLTIIVTWFYNRSGRSIQTTAIFHASMNTFPYVVAYFQLAWLVVFLFAVYVIFADRMWSRVLNPCAHEIHP